MHREFELETERLRLRRYRRSDLDELEAILGDPETMRYYPEPYSRAKVLEWIEDNIRRYREDGSGLWAMELRETGAFAGNCGPAVRVVQGTPQIELGWHVARPLWGQGLAPEAAAGCRDWAFEHLDAERVIALVRPENVPSRRVAEKIGMTVEDEVLYGQMSWVHLVYAAHR
jgi:ribosomal-protein-alanine N-acetyltransferase